MPYVSDAQRRYFNANRAELESQGVDVAEWNSASKGLKLPKKKKPQPAKEPATEKSAAFVFAERLGSLLGRRAGAEDAGTGK